MTETIQSLFLKMIVFDRGQPDLIQHFTKVHSYACLIGLGEALSDEMLETLEAAALVHDIAIPLCLEKYGSNAGRLQEKEGPALARAMLEDTALTAAQRERVCALVGMHHTYEPIDGIDHQILAEADFLVNSFENNHGQERCRDILKRIFKTPTGRKLYAQMFGLEEQ